MAVDQKDSFFSEKVRRNTFEAWPYPENHNLNAGKMAQAGFVYLGHDDAVKCFLCDKELDAWDADDDPMAEHLNHTKHCVFAELQNTEINMTVEEYGMIYFEYMKKLIKKYNKAALAELKLLKSMRASLNRNKK